MEIPLKEPISKFVCVLDLDLRQLWKLKKVIIYIQTQSGWIWFMMAVLGFFSSQTCNLEDKEPYYAPLHSPRKVY